MKQIIPSLLFLSLGLSAETSLKATDFSGDYFFSQNVFITSENRTEKNVENQLKINAISDLEAQVLIETHTKNMQSCQLVGKATLEKNQLVFRSQISPQLNRGKKAQCLLKISKKTNADGTSSFRVDDQDGLCRLQFCGFQAELQGDFKSKSPEVKDKN
jgi:hypothetical protein